MPAILKDTLLNEIMEIWGQRLRPVRLRTEMYQKYLFIDMRFPFYSNFKLLVHNLYPIHTNLLNMFKSGLTKQG